MKNKYVELEKALRLAKEAAMVASADEGGTCNFDAPTLNWKAMGYVKKEAIAVIEKVGLRYWEPSDKYWKGVFIIGVRHSDKVICGRKRPKCSQKR